MSRIDPFKKALTRVTCPQHVTPYLRAELEALGHEIQEEDHVALNIGATLPECMDLCLQLRSAHHVMWLLQRFRCPSPDALYTQIASFPWEDLIDNDSYITVTSNVDNPKIDNTMYPNLVMKDAIVDRITKHTGARPDSGPDRTGVVVHLFWKADRAWVYLNVNGLRLSYRGYRKLPHEAPMSETLAAAVVLATGYDGTQPFINPMCGSGTLAIEAALLATNRAPGLLRSDYGFLFTSIDLDDEWREIRANAKKQSRAGEIAPIIASDHDPRAIFAAEKNAKTAGVDHLITFETCDFSQTTVPDGEGHVVFNPEYGERLGDQDELQEIYAGMGDFLKQECGGYTGHIFTGSRELAKHVGLKPARKRPFFNAQIECRLLSYQLYAGTRKIKDAADTSPTAED
ncbi:MAG: 23S rRNA G2445 N2-methylase RlmL [Phycisphaerales bacterium]|jgi:23S rRNA G2445 N2-methylase RlmL